MRMILDMDKSRQPRRTGALLLVGLAALVAAPGCGGDGGSSGADVQLVATTTQLADIARNVTGDRAEVHGILTPASDPHEYEPRPSDAEAVAEADLILKSGGDLDAWVDQLVESSGSDAPVLALIDSMQTVEAEEDGEIEADPHWWQDPRNAIVAAERIRDALIEADPDGEATYDGNARAYTTALALLDREIAACIDRLAPEQRKLVTSHDALNYFARRYGIEVIGAVIPALTTQAQASAGETAELVDLIGREQVAAIFPEAGVSQSLEQAVAEETGAEIGGELWADALGTEGSGGATYLEAMASNTRTLVEGLSGGAENCEIDAAGP
jgi:zinc/manganese transport system substrate-binding protein